MNTLTHLFYHFMLGLWVIAALLFGTWLIWLLADKIAGWLI